MILQSWRDLVSPPFETRTVQTQIRCERAWSGFHLALDTHHMLSVWIGGVLRIWEKRSSSHVSWMYPLTGDALTRSNALVWPSDTHRLHHVSSLAWVDDHTLVTVSHDATVKEWTITYWAAGRRASSPPGKWTTVDFYISFYKQTNSSLSEWCRVSFVNIWIVKRSWRWGETLASSDPCVCLLQLTLNL